LHARKEEKSDEGRRVELAEAAAEGRGGSDGAEEGAAGEGRARKAREVREAEEDLAEEVFGESADGAGQGVRGHGCEVRTAAAGLESKINLAQL
jgi:hypothetical protein